jgi:upstream activation factor subunit UAF30
MSYKNIVVRIEGDEEEQNNDDTGDASDAEEMGNIDEINNAENVFISDNNTANCADTYEMPSNVVKLLKQYTNIKKELHTHKYHVETLQRSVNAFEKLLNKVVSKHCMIRKRHIKPRGLSGFAVPTKLSNDLCDFLGIDHGSYMARTEVTKKVTQYIKENNLRNPEKKRFIIIDEKLAKLLGPTSLDADITSFSIQKYMNVHFIK